MPLNFLSLLEAENFLIVIFNGYGPIDYSHALDDGKPNAYIRASGACVQHANIDPLQRIILDGLCKADDMP